MDAPAQLPGSIVLAVAALAAYLCFVVALKYAVRDNFHRTRLSMTAFFAFIVATLTISFWPYALITLPYSIPAFSMGAILGYFVGVAGAQERLESEGHAHYREHFAHVHFGAKDLSWWAFANFYTVMGALVLINLVGFSTVLVQSEALAVLTSAVGALLLGTIVPYLFHLWTITKSAHHASSTTKDK